MNHMHHSVQALILAAGKSSRFRTSLTKLSYTICGTEMIGYPLRLLKQLAMPTTVVVGHQKELVKAIAAKYRPDAECIEQTIQKGTGHAVLCTKENWHADNILILNGDVPLLKEQDIRQLIELHETSHAPISLVAAYNADPSITGYGRIITENGQVKIVEQRDFRGDPVEQCKLNAGIYLIKRTFLEEHLASLPTHVHGEIYITDLIAKASELNAHCAILEVPFDNVRGVNTLRELWIAEHLKKSELILNHMEHGVRFINPQSVHIDNGVSIGADSIIGAGVQLRGTTQIGAGVFIDAYAIIDSSSIEDSAQIRSHSIIEHSIIKNSAQIGPFAHVHKESIIGEQAAIGNFVEISKSSIGKKSKAKHLAYIGTTRVGQQANIGAGTVTCNYNGVQKNATVIEDGAFIGSNSSLIAPVTVGEEAIVAAGSVISLDVPAQALAIARPNQINKELYAPLLLEKYRKCCSNKKEAIMATPISSIAEESL